MDVNNVSRISRVRLRFDKAFVLGLRKHGYQDLASAHGGVVSNLHAHGPLSMTDLASLLEKRKPTVTALVNKLLKHNMVETRKDRYDKRVTRVHLTDLGVSFAQTTNRLARDIMRQSSIGLSDEQQAIFKNVLEEMLHNLESYR